MFLDIGKISGIYRLTGLNFDNIHQLLDGGHPPVAITTIMCIIQCFNEVLGIRAISWCSSSTIIPCVSVVRIVRVLVVFYPIPVIFHFPDQVGNIVPHHNPGRGGIRQSIAITIQLGVRHRINGVVGILAVKGLAR